MELDAFLNCVTESSCDWVSHQNLSGRSDRARFGLLTLFGRCMEVPFTHGSSSAFTVAATQGKTARTGRPSGQAGQVLLNVERRPVSEIKGLLERQPLIA